MILPDSESSRRDLSFERHFEFFVFFSSIRPSVQKFFCPSVRKFFRPSVRPSENSPSENFPVRPSENVPSVHPQNYVNLLRCQSSQRNHYYDRVGQGTAQHSRVRQKGRTNHKDHRTNLPQAAEATAEAAEAVADH